MIKGMSYEEKVNLLKDITRREPNYYIDGYVEMFYERYKLIAKIKEVVGAEGVKRLYDLVNEETYELMRILNHLEEN